MMPFRQFNVLYHLLRSTCTWQWRTREGLSCFVNGLKRYNHQRKACITRVLALDRWRQRLRARHSVSSGISMPIGCKFENSWSRHIDDVWLCLLGPFYVSDGGSSKFEPWNVLELLRHHCEISCSTLGCPSTILLILLGNELRLSAAVRLLVLWRLSLAGIQSLPPYSCYHCLFHTLLWKEHEGLEWFSLHSLFEDSYYPRLIQNQHQVDQCFVLSCRIML